MIGMRFLQGNPMTRRYLHQNKLSSIAVFADEVESGQAALSHRR
jgi:hypothetical protein